MKHIDVNKLQTDFEYRFNFLADFTCFTDDDWAAIKESVEYLGPKLPDILDALYNHLLSFDDTERIFMGEKGHVDSSYIELRKEHLTDWVLKTIEGGDVKKFAKYLATTGKKHTGVSGEPGRIVPPRYMVALTSFVQTALTATLAGALADQPQKLARLALAWNKMMMIQLEIFLKVMAPYWPKWDEPPIEMEPEAE